jgi:hypothetical protein
VNHRSSAKVVLVFFMKVNIAPHYRGRKKGKRGGGEQWEQRLAPEVFATGTDQVSVVSHSLRARRERKM